MFRNYIRIAWRSIRKNKVSSIINIIGLTIGLSCCLLIGIYINHELGYDRFHAKGDRIARVIMDYRIGSEGRAGNWTSTKVMPAFKRNFPEVVTGVRMSQVPRLVKTGDKLFNEKRFLFADSTFFELFTFALLKGSKSNALQAPRTVVLTEDAAKRYFGSADPVGKLIKVGTDGIDYMVTGVIENCPSNSQLKFDLLASFSSLGPAQEETYWNANYTTYLLLRDKESFASLASKIPPFMKKEMANEPTVYLNYLLEPLTSVHLHSLHDGFEPNNNIVNIYVLGAIAVLILAIACFTYINLSTARSMERAREVGIRKVSGALKSQIFWQFIGESALLSVIALIFSFALAVVVLPYFNSLADKSLDAADIMRPAIIACAVVITVLISMLAGAYPAVILAGFDPIRVLKGAFKNSGSGLWLRKSLTVFQFVISVFLIIATVTIQHQLSYIRNKKLGFDREHVLVLPSDSKMMKSIDVIRNEFLKQPHVRSVSIAYNTPNNIQGGYSMKSSTMAGSEYVSVTANPVDQFFVETTGLEIIEGSNFTEQDIKEVNKGDTTTPVFSFILNESAAATLGWNAKEAIGKRMSLGDDRPGFVKAVVRDFHFESLHNPIKPLVLFPGSWYNVMMVKLDGKDLSTTISALSDSWKNVVSHRPFEYNFLDTDFNKMYSAELRTGHILNVFAAIAIALACLGLFGLSSYAAQQRIREIGIRKILGANLFQLTTMLSKDFIKLAFLAFLIAAPLSWLVMSDWLQNFNYRVSMSWWIFVVAGLGSVAIAFVTVSFQAIKTSVANPVKNLKAE